MILFVYSTTYELFLYIMYLTFLHFVYSATGSVLIRNAALHNTTAYRLCSPYTPLYLYLLIKHIHVLPSIPFQLHHTCLNTYTYSPTFLHSFPTAPHLPKHQSIRHSHNLTTSLHHPYTTPSHLVQHYAIVDVAGSRSKPQLLAAVAFTATSLSLARVRVVKYLCENNVFYGESLWIYIFKYGI